MGAEFSAFAEAMTASGRAAAPAEARRFDNVAVLGGGPDARLIAALCLAGGAEVTLFSAYGAELEAVREGVSLRGAGPIGAYQADREDAPSIRTTAELDVAVAGAELIFLTGPVHKQRTYAMVLADHLRDGQALVLAPGRSLGALEAAWLLRVGGASADVTLVETQAPAFWFTQNGATLNLSVAASAPAATLPSGRRDVLDGLSRFLPNIEPAPSVLASGFADGSGLVEVPALLMGGAAMTPGGPKIPIGGEALPENESFRALLGPEQERVVEALANERRAVAARFGVRDLPDATGWIDIHAGAASGDGSRPRPSHDHAKRILRDAAIGSLEPLASAGRAAGVPTPLTEAMIRLVSAALGADLAPAGRRLETIGVTTADVDDARRAMDAIARGVA